MNRITIENQTFYNPLFVFAMEAEATNEFDDFNKIFTGLGKVNATYVLTKYLSQNKPDVIINLGTAGSNVFKKGEVVNCNQFIQRDMDVTELGFEKYKTPFAEEEPILVYGLQINNLPEGICGSGDSFETDHNTHEYNVIDMEAYALAWICKKENIPFLCLKYISDGADDEAANDWSAQIKVAAKSLRKSLENRL